MASRTHVRYFVFDIESVADGELISQIKYPGENLGAADAIARWRKELLAEKGKDFIPYTFQLPSAVVLAKVAETYELMDIVGHILLGAAVSGKLTVYKGTAETSGSTSSAASSSSPMPRPWRAEIA